MNSELNTEMMNLFNRVAVGTVTSAGQLVAAIGDMADRYGSDVTGHSYTEMLRNCSPIANEKISRLWAGREV